MIPNVRSSTEEVAQHHVQRLFRGESPAEAVRNLLGRVYGLNAALYFIVTWLVADTEALRHLRQVLESFNLDLL